ncbi:aldehyde ferredoxin oxidoreductase family protein [Desulfoscipio geothermicus]|uniref:Aldehyde:ferredoxin oxidoreductase n=1 Tax=Desulfoscipio geothermicus DSM 3669 TaxID=1121426 RepID=A0A1I6CXT7_9FIRM|nr:aldehyde ferredoxin oxidoreductase family protein [Desulfoscipio geothermicus]SFQ98046.1 aldehyde:ferredoxin oxidoreductase [Desulfoscipio geothermicus DSM 3669]
MKGFYGKLLRINLTDKSHTVETIPEETLKQYLGGKGLGTYLLLQNVKPGTDPLSADNKLIFTTGAATDTVMVGNSRYGVFAKSPLTGGYAESYSGGRVAPVMRRTGYDAIIFDGAADRPVFVEISDRGVTFHDAADLWGQDTYATEAAVLEKINEPGSQALVIGPAGENLVRFACIENNKWRSAGRTGMGAVMGAKKLKAVVFHGNAKAELADPELLKDVAKRIRNLGKDNPGVENYRTYGTTVMVKIMNGAKAFPNRYWNRGFDPNWENLSGDTLREQLQVKSSACPNCFMACGKHVTVPAGEYAGLEVEGPEYETIYAFGGLCSLNSLDQVAYMNDLCDRLGMDTITAGNLVALVMEGAERGLIDAPVKYGDAAAVAELLKQMAERKGLGETLSLGIKEAAKQLKLEDIAIHVKGMEPPGYDPRVLKGMGLAYATSARGACHLRATFYKPELAGMIDKSTTEGKAELFIDFENRLTIFNTQILCVFFRDLIPWETLVDLNKAVTGLEYTQQDLEAIANRIITATREFNLQQGIGREYDTLPPRFFKEKINDGQDGITPEELNKMVDDYYRLRGW